MESRSPRPTPEDLTALLGLLGEALLRQSRPASSPPSPPPPPPERTVSEN